MIQNTIVVFKFLVILGKIKLTYSLFHLYVRDPKMTSLDLPAKTVGAHTVHSVPNLDYWRNLVLDYLDDSDDINLYFAAQNSTF